MTRDFAAVQDDLQPQQHAAQSESVSAQHETAVQAAQGARAAGDWLMQFFMLHASSHKVAYIFASGFEPCTQRCKGSVVTGNVGMRRGQLGIEYDDDMDADDDAVPGTPPG